MSQQSKENYKRLVGRLAPADDKKSPLDLIRFKDQAGLTTNAGSIGGVPYIGVPNLGDVIKFNGIDYVPLPDISGLAPVIPTLAQVLAEGNTGGSNGIVLTIGQTLQVERIDGLDAGTTLFLKAAEGGNFPGNVGSTLKLEGGDANSVSADGGNGGLVDIRGGLGNGGANGGNGGNLDLAGGQGSQGTGSNGAGGNLTGFGGNGATDRNAGEIFLGGGFGFGTGNGGNATFAAGGAVGGGSNGILELQDGNNSPQLAINDDAIGFFGGSPTVQPTIVGSVGDNPAVSGILSALANLGLVIDNTTS